MNEWVSNTTHGCDACKYTHTLYTPDWDGCGCSYCTGKGTYAEILREIFQHWEDVGRPTFINGRVGIDLCGGPVCPTDVIVANEFGCRFDKTGKCYIK